MLGNKDCLGTESTRSQVIYALYIASYFKFFLTTQWFSMQIKLYDASHLRDVVKYSAVDIALLPVFNKLVN